MQEKGIMSCSVIFFFFFFASLRDDKTFQLISLHLVCPMSDVVLQCVETTVSLLFLLSVTALWPEHCGEPLIIDVPLQCHQPLHDFFPPVVDSKVFKNLL